MTCDVKNYGIKTKMSDIDFGDLSSDTQTESEHDEITDLSFYEKIKLSAKNMAEIFDIHEDVAFQCLQTVRWNTEKCMNDFSEDRSKFLSENNISEEDCRKPRTLHQFSGIDIPQCSVCFEEVSPDKLFALPCNHYFCENCWHDHIMLNISNGKSMIRCMASDCRSLILPSDVSFICGEEAFKKFEEKLAAVSVSVSKEVKRCINPKCQLSLSVDSIGLCGIAKCKCGTRMCWKCGNESHAPLSCNKMNEWQIAAETGSKKQLVISNTKPCGKCGARIEKTGGCNHMKCVNCGFEFCWICGHEWDTHEGEKYACNEYKNLDDIVASNHKEDARIAHYYSRYFEHHTSIIIEKEKENEFKDKLTKILSRSSLNSQLSSEEICEKINKITDVRDFARSVLTWSYPHAYMMEEGSTELKLFEFVQKELEMSMERLLFYIHLDGSFPSFKRLMHMVNMVEKSTESLLKHVDLASKI
ncbi:IBR domain containing protein [Tritrichomonas foetus]|uniref:RBR-type E3 ubiquitin transferase n=1 Tax=Tritrichomonas foetus TaxID=1144522 RepID=A0A1J4JJU0_9EUKA|nr:IBR domain containing protein [Tritrichomonas foetus]|eukprot:OHS98623.1 IBR domain containing protein [Tritrichomonas foetus]